MKNFTLKTLALGAALVASASVSAQTITYQRSEDISQRLRQAHRTVPIWGDFTKNGYMDIYYSGTSGAHNWWINGIGGWLVKNQGNGQFIMDDEKAYEDYLYEWDEPVYETDEEGNTILDGEGNPVQKVDENGEPVVEHKSEMRTRYLGTKNGLPMTAYGMGSVVFDYNQDGYVDLLICNTGGNDTGTSQGYVLVKNNGDGTFTVVEDEGLKSLGYQRGEEKNFNEGQEQLKVAVGDYDKDGYPDVLIEGWSDGRGRHICLLHNKKGEGFEVVDNIFKPVPYENEINVRGLYASEEEFDEDGISQGTVWHLDQPTNNIIQASHGPVGFADFDGDGWLDIFVAGWRDGVENAPDEKGNGGGDFRFYRNLNGIEFQDVTDQIEIAGEVLGINELRKAGGNLMIYAIDFNQDGKIDLYFNGDTNNNGKVAMYWQNTSEEAGKFAFEPINIDGQSGVGDPTHRLFLVADMNGDDYPDFYVDGWAAALSDWGRTWQVSDASGAYTTEAYYQGEVRPAPNGAWLSDGNMETGSFGDFDGDGKIDMIITCWEDAPWAVPYPDPANVTEEDQWGHCDNVFVSLNTSDVTISTPDAPANVTATLDAETNDITVTWDPVYVSNGNQPVYNLYLKNKETGKTFMIAPANLTTGKQEAYTAFAQYILGNDEANTYTFPAVEEGTYEVGVQAVNYAYQGSAFTATTEDLSTGIQSVAQGTAKPAQTQIFTTDGRRTDGRARGIYVIKSTDGSVKKVIK